MKLPAILKPAARTAEQVLADMNTVAAERAAADRELHEREVDRERLVADASLDELAENDTATTRARLRIEQAGARWARLANEHTAALQAEEEDRRRQTYQRAERARRDGLKLLAEYERAAPALASILDQLGDAERLIRDANAMLPAGAAPIAPAEPFNGREFVPAGYRTVTEQVEVYAGSNIRAMRGGIKRQDIETRTVETQIPTPMVPEIAHTPLLDNVVLPGVGRDAPPHWFGIQHRSARAAVEDAGRFNLMRIFR